MTKYRIDISAQSLASVLGLELQGGDDVTNPLAAVGNWIEARVYEGLIPELDSAEIDEGGAVNMNWDSEGISIWTDELDEEGLLRLRKRLVQATRDGLLMTFCDSLERGPRLDDIEAIPLPVNQGA